MTPVMRLYEDVLASGTVALRLSALPRMIFVVHGSVTIGDRIVGDGEAWHGDADAMITPGAAGATVWRWEIGAAADAHATAGDARLKIAAPLSTLPPGDLLLRGDSVAFPPGGCAFLHTHQGPGIRCLIEGTIRIDTHGRSASYGPGGAWFEDGPAPVFAQAASDRPSRFIRVMVLPRALLGKSSIAYVNAEDAAKPKSQQYRIYADAPIALAR